MTWKCIEDAGYNADDISSEKIFVFVGASTYDYAKILEDQNEEIDSFTHFGNVHCMMANRVSYTFNFCGESEAIDTTCSSSLVALSKAVDSILLKDNEIAIAGGINLLLHPSSYISFSRAGMLSPDGEYKTFDRDANGYLRGEGCVVFLLKRLSKAIADKDHIYG